MDEEYKTHIVKNGECKVNSVGQRIKTIRISLGLTMKQFGKMFSPEASDSIVSRWERGVSVPNNRRIKQIAELGDVSVKYILTGEDVITISTSEYERLKKIENKFNELSKSK